MFAAIQENSNQLQTSDITAMPEEMVKISSTLYNSLMPLVQRQIRSQIKVMDFSAMSVQLEPAEFPNWKAACDRLSAEATAPLKAAQRRELREAEGDDASIARINKAYNTKIAERSENVASTPLEFHVEIELNHNFLGTGAEVEAS